MTINTRTAVLIPILANPMLATPILTTIALATLFFTTMGLATNIQADIKRLENGQPDLNGVWQVMNRANYDLLPHPARAALAMQPGPFGPVPAEAVVALGTVASVPAGLGVVDGNEIPYLPGKAALQQENQADWLRRDPEIKCYLPGVPRATYLPFPFQIFHSDKALFIAYEFAGATRDLLLKDPGEAPIDSWMGQSYAWWEEDTLVVKVTGQNDQTWFDRTGHYHTEALVVTERYTPVNEQLIEYSATIEDPNVYSKPWTIRMPIYKRVGKDAQLLQFKCIEFVEELLYGELRDKPLNPNRKSPLPQN
jgi:hypothetical protein